MGWAGAAEQGALESQSGDSGAGVDGGKGKWDPNNTDFKFAASLHPIDTTTGGAWVSVRRCGLLHDFVCIVHTGTRQNKYFALLVLTQTAVAFTGWQVWLDWLCAFQLQCVRR